MPEERGGWSTPASPWRCPVCNSCSRDEINAALSGRWERMRDRGAIEAEYGFDPADVDRHIVLHLRPSLIGSK